MSETPADGTHVQTPQQQEAAARLSTRRTGPPTPPGYELQEEVGRGGMGVVHRARDTRLNRDVAVKLLKNEFEAGSPAARMFVEEAQITGQLQHPGIPPVHEVGELPDGRPFLAMKLIRGRTLADQLADRPDPSVERGRFVAVFEQVCQTVAYAHAHNVIHRDLKPGNVMVGAFGEVQVMDWGLAKVLNPATARAGPADGTLATRIESPRAADSATEAGVAKGTPAFMSPEQALGAVDRIDRRSDVFGLGAILCAILTGHPPYTGTDPEAIRQRAARGRLEHALGRLGVCGAEPELVALCKRCLSPEREDRPADAGEVATAVAGLRAAAEERARQAERNEAEARVRAAEERKRRRVKVVAAAAVAVVLAVGTAVSAWQAVKATNAAIAEGQALEAEREAADLARRREGEAREAQATADKAWAEAVEREKKERVARTSAEEVAKFMMVVFAGEGTRGEAGRNRDAAKLRTVKEAMDDAARTIEGRFGDRPELEAAVRNVIGTTYSELGALADAEAQAVRALDLLERTLGPEHPDTLTSANNLALLLRERGRYDEAESLSKRALTGREKVLGPEHPHTLSSANNLALLCQERGRYGEAEPLYKRALAGREKALGPEHPDTLNSVGNLAGLYRLLGRYDEAEPLYKRALRGKEKALGHEHPDTLTVANNLAILYHSRDRFDEAEPLYRRALAGWQKALGPTHPNTLGITNNLAGLYHSQGRYDQAEPLLKRTLIGWQNSLGLEHPLTLAAVNNLGGLYASLYRYDEAEPLLKRSHTGHEKALGPEHPDTLASAYTLGGLYLDMRRYADAVPLLDRAARGYAKRTEMAGVVPRVHSDLGLALLALGKLADAEPHLLVGYNALQPTVARLSDTNRNRLRRVTTGLVEVYDRTGQPEKANEWRAKLAALPPEVAPPPRPVGR